MARYTGKNGRVQVDGSTIANTVGWSLAYSGAILEHRGAGMSVPTRYIDWTDYSGSFEVEADDNDSTQTDILGDASEVTLALREQSGTEHTVSAIIVGNGITVRRSGGVRRAYSFVRGN